MSLNIIYNNQLKYIIILSNLKEKPYLRLGIMEIEINFDKDYLDSSYYGIPLSSNKELCLICYTDETEDGKQWDRYKTKCGHIFHTRCFRRWCGVKNCVNCSFCGDIPEIIDNRYCDICKKFGHNPIYGDACPTTRRASNYAYRKKKNKKQSPNIK